MSSSLALEVTNLNKSYKNHVIFEGAEMSAKEGDVIALVGVNGCGKSTLLNILTGLLQSDGGEISFVVDEEVVSSQKLMEMTSYVPQENFLVESLSAYDNLLFWYRGDKKKLKSDITSGVIKELGVDKYINKRVSKMSGGMKKRVAICCALSNNPKLLLLDEVDASLDIICKLQIQKLLKEYSKKGNIIILATHEEGDIDICNRIIYVENHKLNEIPLKPLKEIFENKL